MNDQGYNQPNLNARVKEFGNFEAKRTLIGKFGGEIRRKIALISLLSVTVIEGRLFTEILKYIFKIFKIF